MLVVEVVLYTQELLDLEVLVVEVLLNLIMQVMVFLEPMDLVVEEGLVQP